MFNKINNTWINRRAVFTRVREEARPMTGLAFAMFCKAPQDQMEAQLEAKPKHQETISPISAML